MDKEIVLSAEEIFYLGKMMSAKYIDYAYVAAMTDISADLQSFEKDTQSKLVKKGYLSENFSGDIELDEEIKCILEPVFFGETETELNVCKKGDVNTVNCIKYHFYDNKITKIRTSFGDLIVTSVDSLEAEKDLRDIANSLNFSEEIKPVNDYNTEDVSVIISGKAVKIGEKSEVMAFFCVDDNVVYEENDVTHSTTKEQFLSDLGKIIRGEI